mmetsp:Transcript_87547/g.195747  ORF Transcript_87547/g.195747 Transcript_87547/m.195747 type:complete len:191 (-) Transcript_87547:170-742(-)
MPFSGCMPRVMLWLFLPTAVYGATVGRPFSDGTIYNFTTHSDQACTQDPIIHWFGRNADAVDCFVYLDEQHVVLRNSFTLCRTNATSDTNAMATYRDFVSADCTGDATGYGSTSWAWYTQSLCETYTHHSLTAVNEPASDRIIQRMNDPLRPEDYPSFSCRSQVSFGRPRAVLSLVAIAFLPAFLHLADA